MNEIIGFVLMIVGAAFDVFGCVGLVRLPDVYNRLQASTKCVTMGTCLLLIGSGIYTGSYPIIIKSVMCAWFLLLTTPVSAHAISRAAHRSGIPLWEGSVIDAYKEDKEGEAPLGG